jgi:transcriptional regulator with XRE-family HTH domain
MVGKQLSSPARAFGVVLRRQRRARHLSQEALALEAGLQRNYLSLIELGRNQPTISTLFKLASGLTMSPAELVRLLEEEGGAEEL